jgi:hypothetical protein
MTRYLAIIGVLLLLVTVVVAQVPSPNLQVGEPFSVQASHTVKWYTADGLSLCAQIPPASPCLPDTTGLDVVIDGVVAQTQPVSALVNDTIAFQFPSGISAGTHSVLVRSIGSGGTAASMPVSFVVDSPPVQVPAPSAQGAPTITFGGTPPTPPAFTLTRATAWANPTTSAFSVPAGSTVLALAAADGGSTAPGVPTSTGNVVNGGTVSGMFSWASIDKTVTTAGPVTFTVDPPGSATTKLRAVAIEVR